MKHNKAPWTDEEVIALTLRQQNPTMHEYTCECGKILIPTTNGWICSECDYTQDWCHAFDTI